MNILYKSPFKIFVKKQNRAFQLVIEDETDKIRNNPDIGEAKGGDLTGFLVHKFVFQKQKYLVAYKSDQHCTACYMIGPHENFYRELKRYKKGG
jgi:hypothetical protein